MVVLINEIKLKDLSVFLDKFITNRKLINMLQELQALITEIDGGNAGRVHCGDIHITLEKLNQFCEALNYDIR